MNYNEEYTEYPILAQRLCWYHLHGYTVQDFLRDNRSNPENSWDEQTILRAWRDVSQGV